MLNELAKEVLAINEANGWGDKPHEVGTNLMLIVSELAEAMEADRINHFHFIKKRPIKLATAEEWKEIEGHEDYEVSNLGRVRSKDMTVWGGQTYYKKKGRILKAGLSKTGYYTVSLRGKTHKVSILVATAFLEKPDPSFIVNHIDGDKTNNNVGNLEWVSHSYNNRHALESGLRNITKNAKLSYHDKVYIAFEAKKGRKYTSILKDRDFGVSKSAIQRVCKEYKKYTDSVEFEISDALIRIMDFCARHNIDIDFHVRAKMEYNKTRGYHHGGKAY